MISFVIFYPFYFLTHGRTRIFILAIASLFFYAWWDYRFLSLLLISVMVDYTVAIKVEDEVYQPTRKFWITLSIIINLGMLGFFKYYNFFTDSFVAAFGIPESDRFMIDVLLPPGISFYTFQTMSYTLDVYRRQYKAERDFTTFVAYVAFFPQLVAGPIERPGELLHQIIREPRFKWPNIYIGLRLFILGCFKKLVIADNLSPISDAAFSNPSAQTTTGLLIGAYCFALQIYCDFSGYSDMARGVARTMDVQTGLNFNLPYLSATLNEFWRRWHMTLSYWLRDYVYIPLGGSRFGFAKHIRNLLITFALSGLWHGAAWTFVIWGIVHGLWITGEILIARAISWSPPRYVKIFITFHVVVLLWVLFRAPDFGTALIYYKSMFTANAGIYSAADNFNLAMLAGYSSPLVLFSIWQYASGTLAPDLRWQSRQIHALMLGAAAFVVVLLGSESAKQFIYFQF